MELPMIWNKEFETMDKMQLTAFQSQKLAALVAQVYAKNVFYKSKMDEAGVKPSDIKHISDIVDLPFITKSEMRDVYPYGLLSTDINNIVEIHTSSGTTGKPVVDAYTQNDIDIWGEVMAPHDNFYEMADARGFLLWQDFAMLPMKADEASQARCRAACVPVSRSVTVPESDPSACKVNLPSRSKRLVSGDRTGSLISSPPDFVTSRP